MAAGFPNRVCGGFKVVPFLHTGVFLCVVFFFSFVGLTNSCGCDVVLRVFFLSCGTAVSVINGLGGF